MLCAALLCAVLTAPSGAIAAGQCEYCVDIPGGDGNGQDPTANASGGSGGSSGSAPTDPSITTPETDASETTDSTDEGGAGGAAGGNGKGGGGDDEGLSGQSGNRHVDSLAPADESTAAAQASDSDDGGFPVILVAIAVLAAAGVGFAAWRLRRGGDGVGRPAESGHSA